MGAAPGCVFWPDCSNLKCDQIIVFLQQNMNVHHIMTNVHDMSLCYK